MRVPLVAAVTGPELTLSRLLPPPAPVVPAAVVAPPLPLHTSPPPPAAPMAAIVAAPGAAVKAV